MMLGLVGGSACLSGIAPAVAQGLCVECTGPATTYHCDIKDAERVDGLPAAKRGIEFVCISQIARSGGHESCRVNNAYAGPCIGQRVLIDLAKSGDPVIVTGGAGATVLPVAPRSGSDQPAGIEVVPPPKRGGPQTVEELVKDTAKQSKKQIADANRTLKKAGEAVGTAIKKSWGCVSSLFTDC